MTDNIYFLYAESYNNIVEIVANTWRLKIEEYKWQDDDKYYSSV